MNEKIVINTGPLVALGKMEVLDFIAQLPCEFCCPPQVENELLQGAALGYPVTRPTWVKIIPLEGPLTPFASIALDDGEAAVIQLALEQKISLVCIDEVKGRRAALSTGLHIIGSLGLLGRAKKEGLIESVGPFIDLAQDRGLYYDSTLVAAFLSALGE